MTTDPSDRVATMRLIDGILTFVWELGSKGDFEAIDRLLDTDAVLLTVDGILTLLTATLPCASKLKKRPGFIGVARVQLRALGYNPEPLLRGLTLE